MIKAIADLASKEYTIRLSLEAVEKELESCKISPQQYKETNSFVLKNVDEDLEIFKECDLRIVSIAYNTYSKIYKDKIEGLQKEVRFVVNFFTYWKDVQKYWAYLLPIFQQRDIANQMPEPCKSFKRVDSIYRYEMEIVGKKQLTYKSFAKRDGLFNKAKSMHRTFEILMRTLSKYLEAKREYFPRLYFLSNEQIIEIVGMMEDIGTCERNLFKMFEGISKFLIIYEKQYEQI